MDRLREVVQSLVFAHATRDSTSGTASLASFGLASEEFVEYVPSPWWVLQWLLPPSEVRPDDVFLEYGCGKGRIVLSAARRYRFARVIGVELSDELSATARALVARERRLKSKLVCIETIEAGEFKVPDDVTYAYLFNPFKGETFRRVSANIIASLDRVPRTLRLIYVNPEEHAGLMATGRFRLERKVRTIRLVSPLSAAIYTAR